MFLPFPWSFTGYTDLKSKIARHLSDKIRRVAGWEQFPVLPALGRRKCHALVFLSEDSEKLLNLRASLEGRTDKTFSAHAKATIFTGKQQDL